MSVSYGPLAEIYDGITGDSFQRAFFKRAGRLIGHAPSIGWEIGCGTGSFSVIAAGEGWDMIGSDSSPDMLAVAGKKAEGMENRPLFLCQDMREPDLYGTVEAAFCCLDGINYITCKRDLKKVFERTGLFIEPGGYFIFDLKTVKGFKSLAGVSSVWEDDGVCCVWQYGYDPGSMLCQHTVDIFRGENGRITRSREEHLQRAYKLGDIRDVLAACGFEKIRIYDGLSPRRGSEECERVLFFARKR